MSEIKLVALNKTEALAKSIASKEGHSLVNYHLLEFSDGEFQPQFDECLRGRDVFLIQSTVSSDAFMELAFAIDAAKRASTKSVIAVVPYFGWGRQDRKDRPRIPIASKAVANMLESVGLDRLITLDLHADQLQGFFDIPVDHIYADKIMCSGIRDWLFENYAPVQRVGVMQLNTIQDEIAIVAPDMGGGKRATRYAKELGLSNVVFCYKSRSKANVVDSVQIAGDVAGKICIIVDDMVDTAGTLCKVAHELMHRGASRVIASATHAVLSGTAIDRIQSSVIDAMFVSDTIGHQELPNPFRVVSVAPTLAKVISKIENYESIVGL